MKSPTKLTKPGSLNSAVMVTLAGMKLAKMSAERHNRSFAERTMAAVVIELGMQVVRAHRERHGARPSEIAMELGEWQQVLEKITKGETK